MFEYAAPTSVNDHHTAFGHYHTAAAVVAAAVATGCHEPPPNMRTRFAAAGGQRLHPANPSIVDEIHPLQRHHRQHSSGSDNPASLLPCSGVHTRLLRKFEFPVRPRGGQRHPPSPRATTTERSTATGTHVPKHVASPPADLTVRMNSGWAGCWAFLLFCCFSRWEMDAPEPPPPAAAVDAPDPAPAGAAPSPASLPLRPLALPVLDAGAAFVGVGALAGDEPRFMNHIPPTMASTATTTATICPAIDTRPGKGCALHGYVGRSRRCQRRSRNVQTWPRCRALSV